MTRALISFSGTIVALMLAAGEPKKEVKPPEKPPVHKVEKEFFKIDLSLKGYFDSVQIAELCLRPEAWTPEIRASLVVSRSLEAGTRVKKGDIVLWFDLEKIDQMIRDLETEHDVSGLALRLAEEELPIAEKTTPIDMAAAERGKRIADEDLKKFLEIDRPLAEKNAEFSVKNARHGLEYNQEELKQLEKMYRAGDMREETEEIIVRRQRNAVEGAQFNLKNTEIRRDQTMHVELPRQEQNLRDNALKQGMALEKARSQLPLELNQKRVNVQKLKYEEGKLQDRLRKLKRDRETMTVRAPIDGIVYYGKGNRGQWNTSAMESRLLHGGTFGPDEVFMTIVRDGPLLVRATVEEKDLHDVQTGAAVRIVPTPFPQRKLAGKIERVMPIPASAGNFDALVSVDQGGDMPPIVPGMACTVKLRAYAAADALAVPTKTVFTEDQNEDSHYVYLWTKSGKPEKHTVTTGRTSGDNTEIKSGLSAGDDILLDKPKSGDK